MSAGRVAFLLVALLGCSAVQEIVTSPSEPKPLEQAIARTVLLQSPGCTGVRVGGGLVVTAAHCVDEKAVGDTYEAVGHGPFVLGWVSPDHDFAVLSGDKEIDPAALVDAQVGGHVYVVGYPVSIDDGKQHLTVTDGVYTGVIDDDMQRLTNGCYYGNSGGGAWDDAGGLVGIVVEIRPVADTDYGPLPFPNHCYAVPSRLLREVLFTE